MKGYLVILLFFIPITFCMDKVKRLSINSDEEYVPLLAESGALAQEVCHTFLRPNNSVHIVRPDDYEKEVMRQVGLIIDKKPGYGMFLSKSGTFAPGSEDAEALAAMKKTIFNEATRQIYEKSKRKQRATLWSCGCLQLVTAVSVSLLTAGVTAAACVLQNTYN